MGRVSANVYQILQVSKALGIDLSGLLSKLGLQEEAPAAATPVDGHSQPAQSVVVQPESQERLLSAS